MGTVHAPQQPNGPPPEIDPKLLSLRRNPPNLNIVQACFESPGRGNEGANTIEALQKVKMATPRAEGPRILCMVYTISTSADRVQAIAETWGPSCDGFLALSNHSNRRLGIIQLPRDGVHEYSIVWQKVRNALLYVFQYHLTSFDYFHICGDDTYVLVENLRQYLHQRGTRDGIVEYLGAPYLYTPVIPRHARERVEAHPSGKRDDIWTNPKPFPRSTLLCGGGPGYTLNRAAVAVLGKALQWCFANSTSPAEDMYIGRCLWVYAGVQGCMDTRDGTGAWRYHQLGADFQYQYGKNIRVAIWRPNALMSKHGIFSKHGLDGISESSVAFHLKRMKYHDGYSFLLQTGLDPVPSLLRRYHVILHRSCGNVSSPVP